MGNSHSFTRHNRISTNLWVMVLLVAVIHSVTHGQVYAEEKGTVVLIRCADPRINDACTGLLNPDERPAVISNTGSVKYFLLEDRLPDLYEQVHLLINKFGIKKLILTNHTHCGFYKKLSQGEESELADLRAAKRKLRETFPEVEIKTYLIDTETSVSTPVE